MTSKIDVDVEAALGKPAQPVHLDEPRRPQRSAARPRIAGLNRSVWPTASVAPDAVGQREHRVGLRERRGHRLLDQHVHAALEKRPRRPPDDRRSARRSSPHRRGRTARDSRVSASRARARDGRPRALDARDPTDADEVARPASPPAAARDAGPGGRRRRHRRASADSGVTTAPVRPRRCRRRRRRERTRRRRGRASGRRRSTARRRRPARIAVIVATPTTGTSNRMSCAGLATLTTRVPGAGERARARDRRVGAFHRLDRDDRAVLHDDRSARRRRRRSRRRRGSRTRSPPASRRSGCACVSTPGRATQIGQQRRRVHQRDAVVLQHVGDGGDQRVGVLRLQPRQHRQQRQVRHDAAEQLHVLDLAGHDGLR